MKTRLSVKLSLVLLVLIIFAYGQTWTVQVKVPFQFKVGEKVLPAGQYRIVEMDGWPTILRIESNGSPATEAFVPVLTRLAVQSASTGGMVFDKIDDTYSLSEVWVPGTDGYLVHSTQEKHQHEVVRPER